MNKEIKKMFGKKDKADETKINEIEVKVGDCGITVRSNTSSLEECYTIFYNIREICFMPHPTLSPPPNDEKKDVA